MGFGDVFARRTRFIRDDQGYRKLLSVAIQDWLHETLNPLTGGDRDEKHSRQSELATAVKSGSSSISNSTISRLISPQEANTKGSVYPRVAGDVAEFLNKRGFYPPRANVDMALRLTPTFFSSFTPEAQDLLSDIEGSFIAYYKSIRFPGHIISTKFKIKQPNDWKVSNYTEVFDVPDGTRSTIYYEGALLSGGGSSYYGIGREQKYKYPRFHIFDRVSWRGDNLECIFGNLLADAQEAPVHTSPVVLLPEANAQSLSAPAPMSNLEELPEIVRTHFKMHLSMQT